MKKLSFYRSQLISTFWFVPGLIIFGAILLATILVYLDWVIQFPTQGWWRLFMVDSADSARTILSTISGAMIGVAGTVFSVTLVALTLASSQLGPRLIKNFMYVRLNQVVLGSYIASYLYCLLVLSSIKESDSAYFIPSLSITVAVLMAVLNIVLLIVFIHHIAVSIQADKVIADISNFMSKQLEDLFPERDRAEEVQEQNVDLKRIQESFRKRVPLHAPASGYLQYVDYDALIRIAKEARIVLELHQRTGAFMVKGMEIGRIHAPMEWDASVLDKIQHQLLMGRTRTYQHDLEFSIHQLVEIGVRALSPGVNDPFTAIACIDNLTRTLSSLAQVSFPSPYRFDDENELRLVVDSLDFEGLLDASLNQMRQFASGSPAVIIRLMEALRTIYPFTVSEDQKQAVVRHAKMVLHTGQHSLEEKNDLEDLKKRSAEII
jgi:uncharacterized membrane protein